ncbi:hypothetical protein [Blastococcus sp. SYSU D00813]
MSTTTPYRLVDVEDLEDGDLAARIAEIGMPPVPAARRVPASPAARQAEVDAVVLAWTVVRDRRSAVGVHGLGDSAAALLA